jgi:16S rRNA (guanine1207-N2)-methyltransferase
VASAPVPVRLLLPDGTLDLTSDSGVFSKGEVDAGTKLLLLDGGPLPPAGDLLDLGCGYGPIALTMARRSPGATVWAVDVNRRAVELTASNAAAAGLANVRACHPDEVPADVRFGAIWSNPPIRIGKAALHELLLTWLRRLDGRAVLVVQKHLGADSLARWLVEQGFPTTRLQSRVGFRLLEITA